MSLRALGVLLALSGAAAADCPAIQPDCGAAAPAPATIPGTATLDGYRAACAARGGVFLLEEGALHPLGGDRPAWVLRERGLSCDGAPPCAGATCETLVILPDGPGEAVVHRGRFDAVEPVPGGLRARRADCTGETCWERLPWPGGPAAD